MATTRPRSLSDEIRDYNSTLDRVLKSRYGMSFRTFKVIKATTQLIGVVAGVYAMSLGADPMAAFALIALIYAGPEAAEVILTSGTDSDSE